MDKFTDFLIFIMNEVGYAVCHQMPGRTIVFQGRHLPVCARDTGLFLGIALCLAVLFMAYRGGAERYPSTLKIVVFACFIAPLIVDASTSYAGLRTTTNDIRLMTGALAGAGIAALVFPLVSRAFLRAGPGQGVFRTWWSVALLLVIPAGIYLALQPRWAGSYWFWALMVTAAVVFTFFILSYTLLVLILEWRRGSEAGAGRALFLWAGLITVAELVLFNRIHWLVYRM